MAIINYKNVRKLSLLILIIVAAAFASPRLGGEEREKAAPSPMRLLEDRAASGDRTAIAILRDSAAAGNAAAMNWLGFLYWQGQGTPLRQDSAIFFLRSASALGNPRAMANLGHLLLYGPAEMRDTLSALSLLGRAAQARSIAAIRELSDFYTAQIKARPIPVSGNQPHLDSVSGANLRLLADLRARGEILPYNHRLSIELYHHSAMLGDTTSQRIIRELLEIFPDALSR